MKRVLFSWLGKGNLDGPNATADGPGSIARVLECRDANFSVQQIVLLDDHRNEASKRFTEWLRQQYEGVSIVSVPVGQAGAWEPTNYHHIYHAAREVVETYYPRDRDAVKPFYLVSGGTPAMHACWLVLSRMAGTGGTLIEVTRQHGVRQIDLPFDVIFQDAPSPGPATARQVEFLAGGGSEGSQDLIADCDSMKEILRLTDIAAHSDLPVLILGETGTGKEGIAKRLHASSGRPGELRSLNCAAIPANLIESELFGSKKGAFTGAKDKEGLLVAAGGGTVFLDEIGELPLEQQAKLLRVLQENKVLPVGATAEKPIHCRFIGATHCNPMVEVAAGRMREDFFYRFANIILSLPPLRERGGDFDKIVESKWKNITDKDGNSGFPGRNLSNNARACLRAHTWPGNIRELMATLARASFGARSPTVEAEDIVRAIIYKPETPDSSAAGELPTLGHGFDIDVYLEERKASLISRALESCGGSQSEAAELLGLGKQKRARLGRWMKSLKL